MRRRPTDQQRRIVFFRARNQCEYCRHQAVFSSDPFEVEHIFPGELGGTNATDNLAMACRGCNHLKHTLIEWPDPNTRIVVPLFHPRRDQWTDHFAWSLDTTQMIGLTSVGRATIDALQLNREGLRNLRRVLVNDQNHPPEEISAGG